MKKCEMQKRVTGFTLDQTAKSHANNVRDNHRECSKNAAKNAKTRLKRQASHMGAINEVVYPV